MKQITPKVITHSLYSHSCLDPRGGGQCESQKGYMLSATTSGKDHICIRCSSNRCFFAELARNPEQITPYFSGTNRLPGCGWSSLCFDSDVLVGCYHGFLFTQQGQNIRRTHSVQCTGTMSREVIVAAAF